MAIEAEGWLWLVAVWVTEQSMDADPDPGAPGWAQGSVSTFSAQGGSSQKGTRSSCRGQQSVSAKAKMHSSDCPNPLVPGAGSDAFIAILLLFIDQAFLAQRLPRGPLALCIVFH